MSFSFVNISYLKMDQWSVQLQREQYTDTVLHEFIAYKINRMR